jgi:hypothetical protein
MSDTPHPGADIPWRKNPRQLLRFIHGSAADEQTRTMALAVFVLSLWQLAGRAMTPRVPSILLVNGESTEPDPLDTFATRHTGMGSGEPEAKGYGTFLGGNAELALLRMSRLVKEREGLKGGAELVARNTGELWKQWGHAKPMRFGSGRAGQYARMRDPNLHWVTDGTDDVILRLDRPEDLEQFRQDVLNHPERLTHPLGYGSNLTLIPKTLAVAGSLSPEQWDDRLVSGIIALGLPVVFLPHVARETIVEPERFALDLISIGFSDVWPRLIGRQIVPDPWLPPSQALSTYEGILRRRLGHFPGAYEFSVLTTIRELGYVCERIAGFVSMDGSPIEETGMLCWNLLEVTTRAITMGIVSLGYHGRGFDAGCPREVVVRLLTHLRAATPTTFRDLQRKVPEFDAKSRDGILEVLVTEGLVALDGNHVAAVSLADFIRGLPARHGLSAPELQTIFQKPSFLKP